LTRSITAGSTGGWTDAEAFLAEVDRAPLFDPSREVVVARAPGRLDLMGGIADYSGSLVLQWPLREATMAAAQVVHDGHLRITSRADGSPAERVFDAPVEALFPDGEPLDYQSARDWFARSGESRWAAYAAGALLVLARERGVTAAGLRVLVRSCVPEGKGVSSSAALEVAVMRALSGTLDMTLDPRELAILCQLVENRVVGAACGVMDQMTSACGRAGELLALLCQPAEIQGTIKLPEELEVWGLDSGERHAVSGSDYTSVRVGAFMGARILADLAGVPQEARWRGYLANVAPSELEREFAGRLPETMQGADFLSRYGPTRDTVTRVDPARTYAVRNPTAHPVFEHFRVRAFADLLAARDTPRRSELLGELMYQSHASYGSCGLGSPGTDLLVALVRERGPSGGLYGAKITGGGSGGTVAVLGRRGSDLGPVVEGYASRTGHRPYIFSGSSPGAEAFGRIRLAAVAG
jgi:galactokinase